jgi:5-methylcytosine-specific restriction endonuclease McrA
MTTTEQLLSHCETLSDDRLTEELTVAVGDERSQLVELLARLGEFDRRRLSQPKGFPSLFEYCTKRLRFSEGGAQRRILAARAARRFPSILTMIRKGELHLNGAATLAPHLDSENHRRLLRLSRRRSQEEIAALIAGIAPRSAKRDSIKMISKERSKSGTAGVQAAVPGAHTAVSKGREEFVELYEVRFTASADTTRKLKRAKELLLHRVPFGDYDTIVGIALDALLKTIDRDLKPTPPKESKPKEAAPVKADREKRTRAIPEKIKQRVWKRDGGRCTYIAADGQRCGSRAGVEFDHRLPWALGGESNEENIRLLCRSHNQHLARVRFGPPQGKSELIPLGLDGGGRRLLSGDALVADAKEIVVGREKKQGKKKNDPDAVGFRHRVGGELSPGQAFP